MYFWGVSIFRNSIGCIYVLHGPTCTPTDITGSWVSLWIIIKWMPVTIGSGNSHGSADSTAQSSNCIIIAISLLSYTLLLLHSFESKAKELLSPSPLLVVTYRDVKAIKIHGLSLIPFPLF